MKDISSYYVNDYNYVPGKRLNSLVRYQIYLKENGTMFSASSLELPRGTVT